MTKRLRAYLSAASTAAVLLVAARPAAAQSLTGAILSGAVRDTAGAALNETYITVRDRETGFTRSLTTSLDGGFRTDFLPPGEYTVRAERLGAQPRLVTGILVRPGVHVQLPLTLAPATPPFDRVDTVAASARGAAPGSGRWVSGVEIGGLPEERRAFRELGRFFSRSTRELETEGLPAWMTTLAVDGLPTLSGLVPGVRGGLGNAAFPLSALANAELLTAPADVEWGGSGALLAGYGRRGSREFQAQAFGSWVGDALSSVEAPGRDGGSFQTLQGGVLVSGPIIRDTASFAVGAEVWRLRSPAAYWPSAAVVAPFASVAQGTYGVALPGSTVLPQDSTDVVSAFGRFDWQLSTAHSLSVRANFAALPTLTGVAADGSAALLPGEGRDLSAASNLTSSLGERWLQDLRVGFESSLRDYSAASAGAAGLPGTVFADAGLAFGSEAAARGRFQQTTFRLSEALLFTYGPHLLKFGFSADAASYEWRRPTQTAGRFYFSDAQAFASGTGYFEQALGPASSLDFALPRFALFVQDRWQPTSGLEVILGLRADIERLPSDEFRLNNEWAIATGIASNDVPGTLFRVGPRAAFVWDVQGSGGWVIEGSGGLYTGPADVGALGDALAFQGDLSVRQGFTTLRDWPSFPAAGSVPALPTLTLLSSDFKAPQTARVAFGVRRRLDAYTELLAQGSFRRTSALARRVDLNLPPAAVGQDQYGRPLYGQLQKQGGLLAAVSGSNRRFTNFGRVTSIEADGWSTYRGVTLGIERHAARVLNGFVSYTLSQTRDNWPLGTEDVQLSPFPQDANWLEGTSDLDVPHRLVVGADVTLPTTFGLHLAGLYRFQSGYPFTPGFRPGVDANGDGSANNDPAFIDSQLAGLDALGGEWACLQDGAGGFAERNACRAPGVHALDLRLGLRLGRVGGASAELFLDALNLLHSEDGLPDRALYLLDAGAPLGGSDASRVVPLTVNPNFGEPLAERTLGRTLRLGFRVNY